MRIYLTHCSAKKDNKLKNSKIQVTPDKLYKSTKLLGFVKKCKDANASWAIFSDKYGIWFPTERHEWYERDPNSVTEIEFKELLENFQKKLDCFDEIFFYYNPGRFHPLYERLLKEAKVKARITKFTQKAVIV